MKPNVEVSHKDDKLNIPNMHFHNDVEIIFVNEGSSTFYIEGKEIIVSENSLIVISNLENHSMKINTNNYDRYIMKIGNVQKVSKLPAEIYIEIFQNRPHNYPYVFNFSKDQAQKIKSIFKTISEETQYYAFGEEYVELLVNQLMVLIYRSNPNFFKQKKSALESTIIEIVNYINKFYYKDIKLEQLENLFFTNKYDISRAFKDITGYTFKTYLTLVRISTAKDLLKNTNETVKEITFKVGYNSEITFIRIFKKYEETTPSNYRKHYKENFKNTP